MRSLFIALFVCLLAAPALAVDPPDFYDFGESTVIYDDVDGNVILMRDRNVRIDQIDGVYYATVRHATSGDFSYELGLAIGSATTNNRQALADAVGTNVTIRYFWAIRARTPPVTTEDARFNVLKVTPIAE